MQVRSSRSSRLILTAAICLLIPGVAAPVATARPTEPALPSEMIEALARDLNLDPGEFLDRADTASRLAQFVADARARFSDSFEGARLDAAGVPLVAVSDGPSAGDVREAAQQAGFRIEATVAPVSGPIAANALIEFAPFDPALVAGAIRPTSYLGGDGFVAGSAEGHGLRCSLGFNAVDASRGPVNITAGHCDPHRGPQLGDTGAYPVLGGAVGSRFGTFYRTSVSGNDYALIDVDEANASSFEGNAVRIPGAAPVHVTGTVDPIVGAPVCKSGTTTGFSCGVILSTGLDLNVAGQPVHNSFSTSICALHGDSGGPIVSGTLGVGISTASNVGEHPSCELATVLTVIAGDRPQLFATAVNDILRDNPGLTVRNR